MNRLNLGCGYERPEGWVNVDKHDYGNHIVADVMEGLPFPDDHFDFVMMNHVLQMFSYEEHPAVLKEVLRVMKKGAKLRIITPNLVQAFDAYTMKEGSYFPVSDEIEKTIGGKLARYIYWHGETRSGFTHDGLADLLWRNGFATVQLNDFLSCELDSRIEESLIMEATK